MFGRTEESLSFAVQRVFSSRYFNIDKGKKKEKKKEKKRKKKKRERGGWNNQQETSVRVFSVLSQIESTGVRKVHRPVLCEFRLDSRVEYR